MKFNIIYINNVNLPSPIKHELSAYGVIIELLIKAKKDR